MAQRRAPGDTLRAALPAVWGGLECTVNRVGDRTFDQLMRTGHDERIEDIDHIAALGIQTIRYPVLWERSVRSLDSPIDWAWPDARLHRLRDRGIRPVVGLVHHGSGPRFTDLLDPEFPEKLARFARAVAERYPWIDAYIPVNEPLTTARFSALYGYWYPHRTSDSDFVRALLHQCKGIALAMAAIRTVNPTAELIQTEDIGRTFSSPALAYQAQFENERRWLTYDLLTGAMTPEHWLWEWLRRSGIAERDLDWFRAHPCPPDILGVNTYLTSDRYLDEHVAWYPGEQPGSNGQTEYVDVAAARVLREGSPAIEELLAETWRRYGRPIVITEVHNGSTVEEQMRWLAEAWDGARAALAGGADVRAVTVWAMLGLYDWHCLVQREEGHYEPGVFDVRSGRPVATPLAAMVHDLATRGAYTHPILATPGWWRRPDRFIYQRVA